MEQTKAAIKIAHQRLKEDFPGHSVLKKTGTLSVSEDEKHLDISCCAGKSAIWQSHFVEVKILFCQYLLKLNICILL